MNMKKYLTLILMLGVMLVSAGSVSAVNFGPIGPDYALANHDSGSDVECTFEVDYDDSAYYEFDDGEELQARWDYSIPTDAVITNVEVHVLGRETDPFIEANIQLWSTDTQESLTDYQSFPYNEWTTLVFQDSDLTNEVKDRVLAGDDIELELDFEGGFGPEAVEIDYMWLLVEYTDSSNCTIEILNPLAGDYFNGDNNILIDWIAEGGDCLFYDVQYGSWDGDECEFSSQTLLAHDITETEYPWDISGLDEGLYCAKITGGCCSDDIEGPFCIDRTKPKANVCVDCCSSSGIESDFHWDTTTGSSVQVWWSDDDTTCGEECIESCEINWGDGLVIPCNDTHRCNYRYTQTTTGEDVYECGHQYNDSGNYTVTVTVEDCAGNIGTDTGVVSVINVVPECAIEANSDAAVGQSVNFAGVITNRDIYLGEVDEDIAKMQYSWDFDDGNSSTGSSASNIFSTAGVYEVVLTVDDTDGGVSTCVHTINVVEPAVLSPQEVAAFYPLEADFGEASGTYPRRFLTGLTSLGNDDCEIIVGPDNLRARGFGNECGVRWDRDLTANPTNDETGTWNVIIRADNGSDYEYYTFDIAVWSWIIDLQEGWNFISVPLVPVDNSIKEVMLCQLGNSDAGCDSSIQGLSSSAVPVLEQDVLDTSDYVIWSYQFDGTDSDWLSSKESGTGDLDEIMPGYGYWVKVEADAKLRGMGSQIDAFPGLPPEREIPTDSWSMIGRYGILDLSESWPNYGDDRVYGSLPAFWDLPSGDLGALQSIGAEENDLWLYDVDGSGHLETVEELFNNEAYWLYVGEDSSNPTNVRTYTPIGTIYEEN